MLALEQVANIGEFLKNKIRRKQEPRKKNYPDWLSVMWKDLKQAIGYFLILQQ